MLNSGCMSQQQTGSFAEEVARAAGLVDDIGLLQTLDDIPCEYVPRSTHDHSKGLVRLTIKKDMVRNASIGVEGDYQPLLYTGGGPLVVDEPCIILRPNPHTHE